MTNKDLQGEELEAHVTALQLLLGDKNVFTRRNVINKAFPNVYRIDVFMINEPDSPTKSFEGLLKSANSTLDGLSMMTELMPATDENTLTMRAMIHEIRYSIVSLASTLGYDL
jgi:hypothetical protein